MPARCQCFEVHGCSGFSAFLHFGALSRAHFSANDPGANLESTAVFEPTAAVLDNAMKTFAAGMLLLVSSALLALAQSDVSEQTVVSVVAISPQTSEPNPLALIAPGQFAIRRSGNLKA